MTGLVLTLIGLLLLGSALLSAAGSAALQVGGSRLRTLQEEGFRGGEALARLRLDEARMRVALRLITGALNLTSLGVATLAADIAVGGVAGAATLVGGVLLILLGTDVIPRALAARHPVRLALVAAPFLLGLTQWLHRLTAPFWRMEEALVGSEGTLQERELREIQTLGQEEGVLEEHETLLVERAFRLDELTAWDVMTPRVDIFAWRDTLTLGEIIGQLSEVPYSRVPVFAESVDDITGILYVREAYQAYVSGKQDMPLGELAREPFFVPGSLSLSRLLRDFQSRRIHMGIVADEFGGIDGLVTLEDVLEELVGEIVDETDVDEEEMVRVSRNEALADAGIDLREINDALKVSLPIVEHRSLNGFILEELGYVPGQGEVLEHSGVQIEIVEATETQVVRARVVRLPGREAERDDADV